MGKILTSAEYIELLVEANTKGLPESAKTIYRDVLNGLKQIVIAEQALEIRKDVAKSCGIDVSKYL